MAEVTFTPLTDEGPGLLDRMDETQVYPFCTSGDGEPSSALNQEGLASKGWTPSSTRLDQDWREQLDRTSV